MFKSLEEFLNGTRKNDVVVLLEGKPGTGKSLILDYIMTVSYTHLDVYKRQD